MAETYKTLTYIEEGPIATLTLNRPEKLNMMDDVTTEEIVEIIEKLRRPGDVRVLILASTGKAFSAGGDLEEILRLCNDYDARMEAYEMGRRLILGMNNIPIPVVVALQGDSFGLGTSMALSSDVIIASKNVRIGDPHVKVGLSAGDGGLLVFPNAFGMARARRHLLTGDPIDAETAYQLGGVTDLVENPEDTLPLAQKIAGKIAALPPVAVQYTKRSINHAIHGQAHEMFEFSLALEQYCMTSDDIREAIAAFKEKRPPVYTGK